MEFDKEKAMYAVCFITLIAGIFLLAFLGFDSENTITGNVVGDNSALKEGNDTNAIGEIIADEKISSDNITQEAAFNAILLAEKVLQEMQEQGFGVVWVNDTLIEAKKYFEGENYTALLQEIGKINDTARRENAKALLLKAQDAIGVSVDYRKVLEKAKSISERKERAFEINDLIRASELRIQEFNLQGLDTSESEVILANAVSEFENERFGSVEDKLNVIDAKLIELSAESTIVRTIYRAGKENIIVFIKDRYKELLLLLGSLLIIAILLYNRIKIMMLRRKIRDMKVEKIVLEDLMKKAQTDYFAKGDITKQTFEIKIAKYKEKFAEIKQKLPIAETLLEKRLKSKRVI